MWLTQVTVGATDCAASMAFYRAPGLRLIVSTRKALAADRSYRCDDRRVMHGVRKS